MTFTTQSVRLRSPQNCHPPASAPPPPCWVSRPVRLPMVVLCRGQEGLVPTEKHQRIQKPSTEGCTPVSTESWEWGSYGPSSLCCVQCPSPPPTLLLSTPSPEHFVSESTDPSLQMAVWFPRESVLTTHGQADRLQDSFPQRCTVLQYSYVTSS